MLDVIAHLAICVYKTLGNCGDGQALIPNSKIYCLLYVMERQNGEIPVAAKGAMLLVCVGNATPTGDVSRASDLWPVSRRRHQEIFSPHKLDP